MIKLKMILLPMLLASSALIAMSQAELQEQLGVAIRAENIEYARALIGHGAQVNSPDQIITFLESAIMSGKLPMVKFLVDEAGADIHLSGSSSSSVGPIGYAALWGDLGIVGYLLDKGARTDINRSDRKEGRSPLMRAAANQKDDSEFIQAFINAGANINQQDRMGKTALHYATRSGNLNAVKTLLQNGADKNLKDFGATPLDLAELLHAGSFWRVDYEQLIRLL